MKYKLSMKTLSFLSVASLGVLSSCGTKSDQHIILSKNNQVTIFKSCDSYIMQTSLGENGKKIIVNIYSPFAFELVDSIESEDFYIYDGHTAENMEKESNLIEHGAYVYRYKATKDK